VHLGFVVAGPGLDGRGDDGVRLARRNASDSKVSSGLGRQKMVLVLTTSVSADMANWVRARRYSSGVRARRSLTAFSAL
jgi:hypothetical protein